MRSAKSFPAAGMNLALPNLTDSLALTTQNPTHTWAKFSYALGVPESLPKLSKLQAQVSEKLLTCSGRLFLQVGNGANSRALRVLDYGKTSHFGDVLWPKHDFPAKLFRLFRSRIDVVYRYVAEPCRGHSLRVRRYRHDSALTHVGSAVLHDRVGEVGHRHFLSSPPEQLRIKLGRGARIGGQELIPAKLAMFGLCGVHIGYLIFLSLRSFSSTPINYFS